MLHLIADDLPRGRIYPAAAKWQARPRTQAWREFGQHWPYTVPPRIQEYFDAHGIEYTVSRTDHIPFGSFYPMQWGFFDFDIDYIQLLSAPVHNAIRDGRCCLLFLYNEGDNPVRIDQRLRHLLESHDLPANSYVLVTSNSATAQLPQGVCFHDFELWYWHRNRAPAVEISSMVRQHGLLILNRLHRSWRWCVMADLWQSGLLHDNEWSYCEPISGADDDNPIEVDSVPGLRDAMAAFRNCVPKFCDDYSQDQRNDHSLDVRNLQQQSYGQLVIESFFDMDQSQGAFLTEKTFKAIKHGHFFFVAGGPGSLAALRSLGYRTFDSVLDNSYDDIIDNTHRWLALKSSIQTATKQGFRQIYAQCLPDLIHNQTLFLDHKQSRLNTLVEQIHAKSRK